MVIKQNEENFSKTLLLTALSKYISQKAIPFFCHTGIVKILVFNTKFSIQLKFSI